VTKRNNARELYIGVISGTSVDGLDIALLDMAAEITFIASETLEFPVQLRSELLALGQGDQDNLDRLGTADRVLGSFIAHAVLDFLKSQNLQTTDIIAIGSHGQTVRHRPDAADPFTWQIGDPNLIAEVTHITTVADFRRRDMAASGQGAPLVPPFHAALLRVADEDRAILNIGGISNLTTLPGDPGIAISGFDTGPGNALMDAWCAAQLGKPYDADGVWAASGKVSAGLLADLMTDPYLQRPPPKSTGREHYNLNWLQSRLPGNLAAEDVQQTLLEFTVVAITEAVANWAAATQRLILCGGGRLNPVLVYRLRGLLEVPVNTTEDYGYDGDAIEAGAFAWLAQRCLAGLTGSASSVTGASGDRVLGGVYSAGREPLS